MKKFLNHIRMKPWIAVAVGCAIALFIAFPQQAGLLLLKTCYISVAVVLGYYADRVLFPYARPHEVARSLEREMLGHNRDYIEIKEATNAYAAAQIRRAIIVLAVVLGFALGL